MRNCNSCGEEINPKRLKLVPHTTHCVACIEAGAVDDVFTYRSAPVVDEYGNFHTAIVKDQKQWQSLNDNDVTAVELLKRVPGDHAQR